MKKSDTSYFAYLCALLSLALILSPKCTRERAKNEARAYLSSVSGKSISYPRSRPWKTEAMGLSPHPVAAGKRLAVGQSLRNTEW